MRFAWFLSVVTKRSGWRLFGEAGRALAILYIPTQRSPTIVQTRELHPRVQPMRLSASIERRCFREAALRRMDTKIYNPLLASLATQHPMTTGRRRGKREIYKAINDDEKERKSNGRRCREESMTSFAITQTLRIRLSFCANYMKMHDFSLPS